VFLSVINLNIAIKTQYLLRLCNSLSIFK